MKKSKRVFFTELSYVLGLIILALGTACMEAADFGVSMVVAPAYLLHLKFSQTWSFFTFGMAEYVLQFILLILLILIVRRFRPAYLFTIVTAMLYGVVLDGCIRLIAFLPAGTTAVRIVLFLVGMCLCSLGVSMLMHTYFSPEVYELVVIEVAAKWGFSIPKTKTVYDCISCAAAILLSLCFFGRLEGVKAGTIACALLNGTIIGFCSRVMEKRWTFLDGLPWRKYFC